MTNSESTFNSEYRKHVGSNLDKCEKELSRFTLYLLVTVAIHYLIRHGENVTLDFIGIEIDSPYLIKLVSPPVFVYLLIRWYICSNFHIQLRREYNSAMVAEYGEDKREKLIYFHSFNLLNLFMNEARKSRLIGWLIFLPVYLFLFVFLALFLWDSLSAQARLELKDSSLDTICTLITWFMSLILVILVARGFSRQVKTDSGTRERTQS